MMARAGWALLHFLWQGTALVVFYAVVRRMLSRWLSAPARYVLACATLALMVVSPVLSFLLFVESAPGASWSISATDWQRLLSAVVVMWLAGVVFFSIRLAGGWRFTARLRSRSTPASSKWQQSLDRLARELGIQRTVRLLISPLVEVPAVIGWLRPAILFPVDFLAGLPAGYISALLAHELAHIRRHDYLANILQGIAETVLFYHPGVWWVSGQIRAAREQCCDELAVRAGGDVLVYVKALAVVEQRRPQRLSPALAASGGSLVDRIRRLIDPSQGMRDNLPGPAAACAMTLLWFAGIAVATVHAAQKPALPTAAVKPVARAVSAVHPDIAEPAPLVQLAARARRTVLYDPVFAMPPHDAPATRLPSLPENPPLMADAAVPTADALASIVKPVEIPAPPAPALDEPGPVFRTATRLVQVDVVARHGSLPARSLIQDNFTLLDNGRPQRIALFSPAPSPGNTVILVDQRNTDQSDQAFVIQHLSRFLAARHTTDPLAIYTFARGGVLHVVQELTANNELLIRAARNLRPAGSAYSSDETDNVAMEASDIMEAVARHLAALPGRKNLIWITAGLPDFNLRMERAARLLTDENVALYAVDARGLIASFAGWNAESPGPRGPFAPLMISPETEYLQSISFISPLVEMTGGRLIAGNNAIEDSIQQAIDDSASGYTLGFYPSMDSAAAWHTLKLKLNQPGVRLRYRKKYFVPGSRPPRNELALADLLREPLNATQLQLVAEATPDPVRPGFCNVRASVDLHDVQLAREQDTWVGGVDFAFLVEGSNAARRIAGRVRIPEDRLADALRKGLSVSDSFALGSPVSRLRVVAQDRATGAAGSVRIPLLER